MSWSWSAPFTSKATAPASRACSGSDVVVEAGDEDHARLRALDAQAPRALQAVDLRHAHVDHGDLRLFRDGELDRGPAVTRGSDHFEPVVVAEQERQRVDEEPVIVDDHDPHRSGLKVSGHELGPAPVSPFPGRGCRSNH